MRFSFTLVLCCDRSASAFFLFPRRFFSFYFHDAWWFCFTHLLVGFNCPIVFLFDIGTNSVQTIFKNENSTLIGRERWSEDCRFRNCLAMIWIILVKIRLAMSLQTGDPLPDVVLYEGDPEGKVKLSNLFSGGKGVLFGVVGAFTPTCSRSHLPEFVSQVSLVVVWLVLL